VEECCIRGVPQGQFTPLPDALCWVIHDLVQRKDSAHNPATLDRILASLDDYFPDNVRPSKDLIYVTLGKLIRDRKVSAQTSFHLSVDKCYYWRFTWIWFNRSSFQSINTLMAYKMN
jgi:hypothetical protein